MFFFKKIVFVVSFLVLWIKTGQAQEQHQIFTTILNQQVNDGEVNYKDLCQDPKFGEYLIQLEDSNPKILSKPDQLAFWINAYNAFTLKLICDHYPLKSINDLHKGGLIFGSVIGKTAWDRRFIVIQEKTMSLGEIEHQILRKEWSDPRIHFAIVCAARSCPPLRSEAFEGFKVHEQLDDQGRIFLVQRSDLNSFDINHRIANLSSILKWFQKDFGRNREELLLYLTRYLPKTIAADVSVNHKAWKINYNRYDWSLNEQ